MSTTGRCPASPRSPRSAPHGAGNRGAVLRYAAIAQRVAAWLATQQHDDGGFRDKWHASPLYATAALTRLGGIRWQASVRRCVGFVLAGQLPGGAWGRWGPTAEETAYAVHTLVSAGALAPPAQVAAALRAGCAYLRRNLDTPAPPLWHDKDLYTPAAVVTATVVAAIHRGERRLRQRHVIVRQR